MIKGVWIGVDVGQVRVGVARSDFHGILASPLVTLRRDTPGNSDIAQLAALVREHEAVGVVIGLPRTLANREGQSAEIARQYGALVATAISPLPVEYVDERLSTVTAARTLSERGVKGKRQRQVIDQAAAVVLLQQWLDSAR